MFNPDHFAETDPVRLEAAITDIGFAALITATGDGLKVTHMPLLLSGDHLEGHMARPNDHWRVLADGAPSLAIFQGPHAYVSPSWYPAKQEHGKVVPTWNYAVVHVHGPAEAIDDIGWLTNHVSALTDRHEGEMPKPWATGDAPGNFIEVMARGIVGVRLTIERMEGKWKMSQNRNSEDAGGARRGLESRGRPQDLAVAGEIPVRQTGG